MSNSPLTVTELTARIKQVLEQGFAQVEVTGEISRLTTPSSGHLYFTIKDAHAAISAVVWRSAALRLKTRPKEGQAYIFIGHLSLYEPRGTYQLVITRIASVGAGRLAAEFERRKALFAERGWFETQHKKNIPKLPKHIGIVTSQTAAAYEDVKKVLSTRPAWLNISLSPAIVQGNTAAESVVTAIQRLHNLNNKPDVILLVRGGGSMEDLWCFNDEHIIKAIFEAEIPIISGIGHEIDTTLSDLVADLRAATPSNAAELCCPARQTLKQQLPSLHAMASLLQRRIHQAAQQQQHLQTRQTQALNRYQDQKNWAIERLSDKNKQLMLKCLHKCRTRIRQYDNRLHQHEPNQRLRLNMQHFYVLKQRLQNFAQSISPQHMHHLDNQTFKLHLQQQQTLQQKKQQWLHIHDQLFAMNPKHVLSRGYAMTTDQQGKVISSMQHIHQDDIIQLHFNDGIAHSKIIQKDKNKVPTP